MWGGDVPEGRGPALPAVGGGPRPVGGLVGRGCECGECGRAGPHLRTHLCREGPGGGACGARRAGEAPFTGEHLVFVLRSGNAPVDGHVSKRQAGDRQETLLSTKYLSFSFTV